MSERKGETKRQHYVPRMILKNFSKDGKRISLFVKGERIDGASLRDQCYGDYFYGADNVLEKSFAAEETKIAAFFGDLSPDRFANLSPDDIYRLRLFLIYQHARTMGAAKHLSRFAGAFAKTSLKGTLALNKETDLSPRDLDDVEIGLKNAQFDSVWMATKTAPILLDMDVKFITTDRTPGFVVSDHPVIAYNQFAEHHPILGRYPTTTGLACKGLQLFMPLSPSMVLALFDPSTYQYGGKSFVCRAGPSDVKHLNRMQAVNALSCLYFHEDRIDDPTLEDLGKTGANHPSIYEKTVATGPMIQRQDGQVSQFVLVHHVDIRVGAKLNFIRTIDGHSYETHEGPTVPIRSPELLDLAEQYGRLLEEKVKEGRARADQTPDAT